MDISCEFRVHNQWVIEGNNVVNCRLPCCKLCCSYYVINLAIITVSIFHLNLFITDPIKPSSPAYTLSCVEGECLSDRPIQGNSRWNWILGTFKPDDHLLSTSLHCFIFQTNYITVVPFYLHRFFHPLFLC
jgi:hypothetical protein